LFCAIEDLLDPRRAVTHLHHGHSCAAIVEQLFADALEDRKWKRSGASVEIEDTP
jgi:hypothetical protein